MLIQEHWSLLLLKFNQYHTINSFGLNFIDWETQMLPLQTWKALKSMARRWLKRWEALGRQMLLRGFKLLWDCKTKVSHHLNTVIYLLKTCLGYHSKILTVWKWNRHIVHCLSYSSFWNLGEHRGVKYLSFCDLSFQVWSW